MFNFYIALLVIITLILFTTFLSMKIYNLKRKMHQQNLKTINLYLDKKLIIKLLNSTTSTHHQLILDTIAEEILHYFCIDFLAIKFEEFPKILTFKNDKITKLYKDTEIHSLLKNSENIERPVGYLSIKIEDKRQFIVFKHDQTLMLAIVEPGHKLSTSEQETLGNEIMLIIKIILFIQKESQRIN